MTFCLQRRRSSLFFGFYLMIITTPKANKTMCCKCEGTKSMTKNKPEGHGIGEQLPKMRELMEDFWELRGINPGY